MLKSRITSMFLIFGLLMVNLFCCFVSAAKPKTLLKYAPYHDQVYYDKIQKKKYTREEIQIIENFLKETVNESDFSVATHIECINSIIDQNQIKSSVQIDWDSIKNSKYDKQRIDRRWATAEIFNVDISELEASDYEKYGYLSCKDKRQDIEDGSDVPFYYGNVIMNLEKENVLERTTLTIGDSLDNRWELGERSITPTLANNPRITCIPGHSRRLAKLISQHIKSGSISPKHPNLIHKIKTKHLDFSYIELQIHGELSFKKDVESIHIIKLNTEEEEENARQAQLLQQAIEKIQKLGKPCYIVDCTDLNFNKIHKTTSLKKL